MKRTLIVVAALLVLALSAGLVLAAELIQDGSFELGNPNPYWDETSTGGWDIVWNGLNGRTGDWYAWIGGLGGAGEVGQVWQEVTVPEYGEVEVSFWLFNGTGDTGGTDTLEVWFDGSNELTIPESDATYAGAYAQVMINVGEFAAGDYELRFRGTDNDGGNTNWFIDDVSVNFTAVDPPAEEEEEEAEPVYQRWDPGDARINPDPAMEVAIYCVTNGIDLWGFSDLHYGFVSLDDFLAAPATDDMPFYTSADGTVRVYHLSNDWWGVQKDQVRGDSTETYEYAWDGCPRTQSITAVYDAAGNLLVWETGP